MVTTVDRTVLRTDYHDGTSGVRHVTLTGEADLATVGQLEDDLALLLAPRWVTRLAVDLTALRHLDCAALAALLAVRDHATARGQQVVITAAAGAPERVLALGDIGRLFDYPPLT
ncbi:hypothetical protein AWW66_00400 [Micromonospora rosaria]|uniref:STAS domain-containing protein n=1 Tax=Micromonospora rosaria TaxID=47874 RepID=A0A136Q056_9ACTN|nr:STAS domain-containing protein [Micromonospora rosaria]KXK63944.1 hypothetical protein AWW66_00400 [Micromonospora rosaria]